MNKRARIALLTALLKRLAKDLSSKLGRGFSERTLEQMRAFYLTWPNPQTLSAESGGWPGFRLPWSHYVRLLSVSDAKARAYYERALIDSLEQFLLELGNDFALVDLVFFHRQLRSLIIVDLKLGKFTHADAGQMNLYLN